MNRQSLAGVVIVLASLAFWIVAHELLCAHAIDSGMAGSLLGRPALDTTQPLVTAVQILGLRLALLLLAPGVICATLAWLLVKRRRRADAPSP